VEVTPQEIVARGYDLLGEYGWCRGSYARDDLDKYVPVRDPRAVAFCSIGAINRAALDLGVPVWTERNAFRDACDLFADTINETSITYWNDYVAMDEVEVREAFRVAAGLPAIIQPHEQVLIEA
jgi:hypothetical protein